MFGLTEDDGLVIPARAVEPMHLVQIFLRWPTIAKLPYISVAES